MRYFLVIPAAGSGRRFASAVPKQYAPLGSSTVIEHALAPFEADPDCAGICVALAAGDADWPAIAARRTRLIETTEGGEQRAHSVRNALRALATRVREDDWIMVHDAARPCFAAADLALLKRELSSHPVGGLLAVPLADTLKRALEPASHVTHVDATLDRDGLWRAATPQVFRFGMLLRALEAALASGRMPTDEAQAIEWSGQRPRLVAGRADNIKVTTADDLALAGAILSTEKSLMRIGSGFDVHAFGPGNSVILGGVRIPHTRGVIAHSDGDVVLHALCDAMLGAAGLGDIGMHFPDTDPVWKGAESRRFVAAVLEMLSVRKLKVGNADVTLLAQSPKVSAYRLEIRRSMALMLGVTENQVNIKATTTEHLGFIGRNEGLAAQVVVLLEPAPEKS